ncbi:MAG: efflux RND transporter periplasmic adaptor subunit [Minisyncoccia bacterium]|jgi:RND family efflux transporter MFP subunit
MKAFFARLSVTKKILLAAAILLVAWGVYHFWFAPTASPYQFATAARGTVTQIVSVTGNTAPVHDVDLAFENGGIIASVSADVGSHVNAGGVIVRLDTSDLQSQLAQAQANVDTQAAKLQSLEAGSRPEDITISQTQLAEAEQTLANTYAGVNTLLADAYAKSNDAVRNQLASFFSNPEGNNPQWVFPITDSQLLNDINFGRLQASTELNVWATELAGISDSSPSTTLDTALADAASHLTIIQNFLNEVSAGLTNVTNIPVSTTATYKTDVTAGLNETNAGATEINTAIQGIASEKISVQQLQAQLALTLAGSTQNDIDAQKAQVEQAQASAQSIQVSIGKASLVAPVSGVITVQNAKVGEIATPGAVLVSLISDQGLEVNAQIAEADIGKVSVGDVVSMTLDAFQGKTFSGKVTYIDPGETLVEGVPTYKTTFQFDNLGSDVKPGMTANLDITTATHENVIYIPQRYVTTNADGTYAVQAYHGAKTPLETRSVTTGIRDQNGNIEIMSGLEEGEVVARSSSS